MEFEYSNSELHSQFVEFIQSLQKEKDEMILLLDLYRDTSSPGSVLVQSFKDKIIPAIESLVEQYLSMYRENARTSCQYENELRKSTVFERGYAELSSFLAQMKANYNQLWAITAAFAKRLLESDTENANLHSQYNALLERSKIMAHKIEELQNKLLTAQKYEEWVEGHLMSLLVAPSYLVNAQNALEQVKNANDAKKEEKIMRLKNEKKKIQEEFDEFRKNAEEEMKIRDEKYEMLEKEKKDREITIDSLKIDYSRLEEELQDSAKVIDSLKNEIEEKKQTDKAISDFCMKFNFISFDGKSFEYQADDSMQQTIEQKALETLQKEKRDLTNQVNNLKKKIEKMNSSFENDIETLKASSKYEVDALENEIRQNVELREEAISELRKAKLQYNQIEKERQRSEEKVKKLTQQNQELKTKYIEIQNREDKSLKQYEASLEQITGIDSSSLTLPSLKMSMDEIANSVYQEANENLQKINNELKSERELLLEEITKLKKKIQNYEEKNEDIQSKVQEMEREIQSKNSKLKESKERYNSLLKTMKDKAPIELAKYNDLNDKIDESNYLLSQKDDEIANLIETKEKQKKENETLAKETQQLKVDLNIMQKTIGELQSSLDLSESQILEKQKEIYNLKEQLENSRTSNPFLKAAQLEISKLKKQIDEMNQEKNEENTVDIKIDETRQAPAPEIEEPQIIEVKNPEPQEEEEKNEKPPPPKETPKTTTSSDDKSAKKEESRPKVSETEHHHEPPKTSKPSHTSDNHELSRSSGNTRHTSTTNKDRYERYDWHDRSHLPPKQGTSNKSNAPNPNSKSQKSKGSSSNARYSNRGNFKRK